MFPIWLHWLMITIIDNKPLLPHPTNNQSLSNVSPSILVFSVEFPTLQQVAHFLLTSVAHNIHPSVSGVALQKHASNEHRRTGIVCMQMVTEQRYMHVSNWKCRRWHRHVSLSSLFDCTNKEKRKWLKTRQNLPFAQPSNLVAFLIHHACGQRPQAFIVTLNCGFGVSVIRILWRSDVVMGKKTLLPPSPQSEAAAADTELTGSWRSLAVRVRATIKIPAQRKHLWPAGLIVMILHKLREVAQQ